MARKLNTYETSLGFFDLAIAAPSMMAALGSLVIVLSKVALMTRLPCADPPAQRLNMTTKKTGQRNFSPSPRPREF